jgi:hypothetical protein
MTTIAQRIERLLDQLDAPSLSEAEVKKIKKKLEVLRTQQAHAE